MLPWSKERIIEAILLRAFDNEPLGSQAVHPRALALAGRRVFGSWGAALVAAGLDPKGYMGRWPVTDRGNPLSHSIGNSGEIGKNLTADTNGGIAACANEHAGDAKRPEAGQPWTSAAITQAIIQRLHGRHMMNATAVYYGDRPLYRAAVKNAGNWRNALLAAGLNPDEFRAHQKVTTEPVSRR